MERVAAPAGGGAVVTALAWRQIGPLHELIRGTGASVGAVLRLSYAERADGPAWRWWVPERAPRELPREIGEGEVDAARAAAVEAAFGGAP